MLNYKTTGSITWVALRYFHFLLWQIIPTSCKIKSLRGVMVVAVEEDVEILESAVILVLVLIQEVAIGLDFGRKTDYLSVA